MSDLFDLVEPLKRAVAVPGEFTSNFANTTDDDVAATLLDAFAEAQLYGFFAVSTSDDNGIVTPDLNRGEGALIVIFAMCRVLASEIRNRKSHTKYEAKGAIFEQDQSAGVLVQLLKEYQTQKADLLKLATTYAAGNVFVMADQYFLRAVGYPQGFSSSLMDGEWFNYASSVGPF